MCVLSLTKKTWISAEINLLKSPCGMLGRSVTWKSIQIWFLNARKRVPNGSNSLSSSTLTLSPTASCSRKSEKEPCNQSDEGEESDKEFEGHDKKEDRKFQTIAGLENQQDQVQKWFASVYQTLHQETDCLTLLQQVSDDETEGQRTLDTDEDQDIWQEPVADQDAGENMSPKKIESNALDEEDGIFWYDPSSLR
jgi:hypothetical protein